MAASVAITHGSLPHLLHLELSLAHDALQPFPRVEQVAALLVDEQHQRRAVALNVAGQHLGQGGWTSGPWC